MNNTYFSVDKWKSEAKAKIAQGVLVFVGKLTVREWKIIKPELIATDLSFRRPGDHFVLTFSCVSTCLFEQVMCHSTFWVRSKAIIILISLKDV